MTNTDTTTLIQNTIAFVKDTLRGAEGGHDWFHIERVFNTATKMAQHEDCNPLIVQLGALLHDIADSKFYNGDESVGPLKAKAWMDAQGVSEDDQKGVLDIVKNISFKSNIGSDSSEKSIELQIVQDADRLDAMGAIGIARAFNYGGFRNRGLYDPTIPPNLKMSKEEYKSSKAPTINHFYEKLLLLKDLMNTNSGRQLAQERHDFMVSYLDQFYKEWSGE